MRAPRPLAAAVLAAAALSALSACGGPEGGGGARVLDETAMAAYTDAALESVAAEADPIRRALAAEPDRVHGGQDRTFRQALEGDARAVCAVLVSGRATTGAVAWRMAFPDAPPPSGGQLERAELAARTLCPAPA